MTVIGLGFRVNSGRSEVPRNSDSTRCGLSNAPSFASIGCLIATIHGLEDFHVYRDLCKIWQINAT